MEVEGVDRKVEEGGCFDVSKKKNGGGCWVEGELTELTQLGKEWVQVVIGVLIGCI